jgi:hypothetical protein
MAQLRVQHSGIPAVATVRLCNHSTNWRNWRVRCSGVWPSGGGEAHHWVDIYYVGDADVGHDINVHISHSRRKPMAIPDGSRYPVIMLAAGCALVGAGIVTAVIPVVRRRRRPDGTQQSFYPTTPM